MNRLLVPLIALGCLLTPGWLLAQGPGPYVRPTTNPYAQPAFSPYLNLLRSGSNPAVNYYGLVRPEINARNAILGLEQQVNVLSGAGAEAPAVPLGSGHPTQFNNLSHYFPGSGTSGAQPGRQAGPPAGKPRPR